MNSEGGQHASGKRLIIELKVRRDAMIVFGWRNSTLNYNFYAPLNITFLYEIYIPYSDHNERRRKYSGMKCLRHGRVCD